MFSAHTKRSKARLITTSLVGIVFSCTTLSALASFKQPGKIIAGSDMTFYPYEYMKDNKPAGFDIEYLDGLAKIMGLKASNIDTRWANLIPGLRGGRFDLINSSMYITAPRLKVIDMIPYSKSGESILSLKGASYQPKTMQDFCGHTIGSMAGTAWLKQMQNVSKSDCVKKGLKPIKIRMYPTDPQTTQAMLSHAVEAQITDSAVAQGVVQRMGSRVTISSDKLLDPVLHGFGVKKGNDEVRKVLIEGIKKYSQSPEYAALLKKYNMQDLSETDIKTMMPKD
ncbi:transporter substrate-binding domain-containing protein [Celerinatantimonas yamalensis]|uniref:Transporter substrate-binding domain-containing protein n=2 Tax=Celerinatantimonas yamalensis TaxID=559956 RepID=A0ABW9G2A6_9GAMM